MRNNNVDMLHGSIAKGILSMAVPLMIMNVLQNMFSVIDMTVLGNLVNDTATGAVGACGTLITLFTGILLGMSTGANVIVAKYIGAGNKERTARAVGTSLLFSVVGGLALSVIGVVFAETFLVMTNCPETLLGQAVLYFRLYFIGAPIIMVYNFSASILRAVGDTRRPLYYLMIGGAVKVVLNICCIVLLDMTVEGVAIATIVCNLIAGVLTFRIVLKNREMLGFRFGMLRFYKAELLDVLQIGVPAGIQTGLYSFANVIIATAVNSFGENATTGISIANQFDGILYQICCATAFAAAPYIAQNVGAHNIVRAKKSVITSVIITVAFGAGLGSLSAIFSPQLSSLMSSTPEVIAYSCQKMMIISSTYFICGINEVMGGALRGIGKPIIPTVSTLIFMCAIRFVWVYAIFPLVPNLTFLYLVWPIGWVLSITTQLIFFIPSIRKLSRLDYAANHLTERN